MVVVVVDCCLWFLVPLVVWLAGLLGLIGCLVATYCFCLLCRAPCCFPVILFRLLVVCLLLFFCCLLACSLVFCFPIYVAPPKNVLFRGRFCLYVSFRLLVLDLSCFLASLCLRCCWLACLLASHLVLIVCFLFSPQTVCHTEGFLREG